MKRRQSDEDALPSAQRSREERLQRASDAAERRLSPDASIFELTNVLLDEVSSHGLPRVSAAQLAIQSVLSTCADEALVKRLARELSETLCALGPLAQEDPEHSDSMTSYFLVGAFAELRHHRLEGCALNVASVLVAGDWLSGGTVQEAAAANDREWATHLQPLLEWVEMRASERADAPADVAHVRDAVSAQGSRDAPLWREISTEAGPESWEPNALRPTLNAALGTTEAVVVLDGLVSERQRAALHALLDRQPTSGSGDGAAGEAAEEIAPRDPIWERTTCDGANLPLSWGASSSFLRELESEPPAVVREIHERLVRLYPEYLIAHMPPIGEASGSEYGCTSFVANASTYGSCFQWHVDADPTSFPPSEWVNRLGDYVNGELGKPLFVSLIVYTDERWRQNWDAETLFLEPLSGCGLFVQPRPGRAVLMHQDALHRVSCPSMLAKRPRYSLVWKLLFIPREGKGARAWGGNVETICRPEWGGPVRFPKADGDV